MRRGTRSPAALAIAIVALFAALGGTVYAAGKLDGRQVKPKSMPGNRLKPGSLPANRLQPGSITGELLAPGAVGTAQLAPGAVSPAQFAPGSITGNLVDAATLGQVPSAVHADSADSARDAQTALNAVNALDAVRINGHSAGCGPGTRAFAGACWQTATSDAAVPAPTAATSCATQGGELPGALELAAFSQQPGIVLAPGDEWSGDVASFSGPDIYALIVVSPSGEIKTAASSVNKRYRCVIPLVT
jgi:hypothetical protein